MPLMRPFTLLALFASLSFGCTDSHGRGCEGDAPACLTGWSGTSSCCLDGTEADATCVGDAWVCASGSFVPTECGRIDPICEGTMIFDGGLVDGGLHACDAGPISPCLRGWGGSSDCCLAGDTAEWLCNASGALACPPGYFSPGTCRSSAAVCESVDAGTGLYDDCDVTSDCTLTDQTCCGVCGQPTSDDVAAVHTDRTSDYYRDVACPESVTGPVICPDCIAASNPHLFATCDTSGFRPACAVVDFGAAPFSECTGSGDCVLATATCCACGAIAAADTIAVSRDEAFGMNAITCDELGAACPPCVPAFDPGLSAICNAGRCMVVGPD